jgi:hypothetical protein
MQILQAQPVLCQGPFWVYRPPFYVNGPPFYVNGLPFYVNGLLQPDAPGKKRQPAGPLFARFSWGSASPTSTAGRAYLQIAPNPKTVLESSSSLLVAIVETARRGAIALGEEIFLFAGIL